MQVKLIDYTGAGSKDPSRHAANVLVFTKQTRLKMEPDLFEEIESWSWDKIEKELEYMANTIPSSWEMVHYSFLINGVTRGFTHQFVRTRTGSYAQQTQRVLDVGGWGYGTGPTIKSGGDQELADIYHGTMQTVAESYDALIDKGAAIEDARGVLPTNIHTNICANFSLRVITDLVRKRSSSRTQGEYRDVLEGLKSEVVRVHPWAQMFIDRNFDVAALELESKIKQLKSGDVIGDADVTNMIKLIDQMRKG